MKFVTLSSYVKICHLVRTHDGEAGRTMCGRFFEGDGSVKDEKPEGMKVCRDCRRAEQQEQRNASTKR